MLIEWSVLKMSLCEYVCVCGGWCVFEHTYERVWVYGDSVHQKLQGPPRVAKSAGFGFDLRELVNFFL